MSLLTNVTDCYVKLLLAEGRDGREGGGGGGGGDGEVLREINRNFPVTNQLIQLVATARISFGRHRGRGLWPSLIFFCMCSVRVLSTERNKLILCNH